MLTIEELYQFMTDIESDRIERIISINKTDKFAQAVCAFANDFPRHWDPGYLLLGVNDDGSPSGLQVDDRLLQNLVALRSDGNIQSLPALTVQKYTLPNAQGEVAVVEVFPADLPPVRYKGQVWIRVGPRRAIASETEERQLSERRAAAIMARHFDARPCLGNTLNDLSLELFRLTYLPNAVATEVIDENHRSIKEQLASLRFFDLNQDCPTHAGILLFAKIPTQWLPGAYIQFLRIAGTKLTDEVETEQVLDGDLLMVLRELDSLIKLHNQFQPIFQTSLREQMRSPYPIVALRELLLNAVMHRGYEDSTAPIRFYWFSDRIEIQNPGGLYGEVTPENFPRQNAYRNPVLAEAMKVLGYVNKFGRGVLRAQESLAKNGNPPAEFQFESSYFLMRSDRPVKAYGRWMDRMPQTYRQAVLNESNINQLPTVAADTYCLATLKNYRSLMPMAMEVHKPMFHLKPADGAIGAHMQAVSECYNDFKQLATVIADNCHIQMVNHD